MKVEDGAEIVGPSFLDEGVTVKAGARVLPYSVIGRHCQIDAGAVIAGSILWPNTRVGSEARVEDAICGRNAHIGRNVTVGPGAVLGSKTVLTDFSRA